VSKGAKSPTGDVALNEVKRGERFNFGRNWRVFLGKVSEDRIAESSKSLLAKLERRDLRGIRFLDIGSGSGLSSLAASRAGAAVTSFDFDPQCVACTAELRQRFAGPDRPWNIVQGSVLDTAFMETLGTFDIVYSWGVLHHTGQMWQALDLASQRVDSAGGMLFVALYNDQGWISRYWARIKRLYNHNGLLRGLILVLHAPYFLGAYAVGTVTRGLKGEKRDLRGMSFWTDISDWLGGYPFEVAKPDAVAQFLQARGFRKLRDCRVGRRHGCNEFVFARGP
jgi:2-polyprenyl-6-hydroxyphenyl methylase/3-demethylubiquinone-9 3-methyltransferase